MSLTVEQLAALPEGAVVRTHPTKADCLWVRRGEGVKEWAASGRVADTPFVARHGDGPTLVSLPVAALVKAAGGDPNELADRLVRRATYGLLDETYYDELDDAHAAEAVLRMIGGTLRPTDQEDDRNDDEDDDQDGEQGHERHSTSPRGHRT